ncbi:MAG: hypothetical protein M3Q53_04570 [Actinomycetota bacterium]|nr:hypothetical protein [Actinomycetota bacterium]
MDHPIHPSARGSGLRLIAPVVAAALVLAGAPVALAGPATDEYKLELPEVERAGLESVEAGEAREPTGAQDGVVAEDVPAEGTLEATGSTLLATPMLIAALLGIGLLSAVAIATRSREARP